MNKFFIGMLCLCFAVPSLAQNLTIEVLEKETMLPLTGASVQIDKQNIDQLTNHNGMVKLDSLATGDYPITISLIGYKTITDTLKVTTAMPVKTYYMQEGSLALDKVVVTATRSTRTIKRIPTRIEFIGSEELGEKAMMNAANISMVLRESTGIQIQQTSLSSANSSIKIQGLDGRYTQILKDGFPLFGGFSGGLSINQIPPLDLKQFELIKGSASTLYGGGAIAGLVNLVSKTPEEEPNLDIQLAQTDVGGSTANIYYSQKKNKFGYTLYGSGHYQKIYEPDNDGFSNLPRTKSISFYPKLFYYPTKNQTFWLGINGTFDKRKGGDITAIEDGPQGIHVYMEENKTARISSQAVYENQISKFKHLQIKNSISFFDRDLSTPHMQFLGRQWDVFTEVNYSLKKNISDWVFDANFYSNSFKEKENPNPRDQEHITWGGFVNNTTDLSKHFILESGLRTDYSPDWGVFALPRISLLYKANNHFTSRLGGGAGYKIPDMFTEEAATLNYENILPIDKDKLKAERSFGANIDFNYKNKIFGGLGVSINQLFYLTYIDNALLLNYLPSGKYEFKNANGKVLSRGAETNLKFTYKDFRWFLNYSYIHATLNYLPHKPSKTLTPKHKAGSVIMYENDQWRIGYETYYTGSQKLSSGETTRDYLTMGLLVQKHFKWGSPYVNFENFTDRRQSKFSPETLPPHQSPQFAEIYAPTDGFVFTLGIIFNPFGREEHHD